MLLYVDVIDACHLTCPTCVRGVRAFPNTGRKMPLALFREIVAKAKADGAYKVDIFSWIEPFLCRNLHEYIAVVKEAGLPCGVSSTLSLRKISGFEEALRLMDTLTVSISGASQAVYEVNHRGGRLDWVRENLARIAALRQAGGLRAAVTLRMLRFDYNGGEEPALRELAAATGVAFEVLTGEGHPVRRPQRADTARRVEKMARRAAYVQRFRNRGKVCPLIFEHVTVNVAGDVYQCTAYGNYETLRIGLFLELSREEVLMRRQANPVCRSCAWVRRPMNDADRLLLAQAEAVLRGEKLVERAAYLSRPAAAHPVTTDGHLVAKSRVWKG
jgi:MoaA/NifB/PqqE/SkfB family radical SAM enzyme